MQKETVVLMQMPNTTSIILAQVLSPCRENASYLSIKSKRCPNNVTPTLQDENSSF